MMNRNPSGGAPRVLVVDDDPAITKLLSMQLKEWDRSRQAGMDYHLVKPFRLSELLELLASWKRQLSDKSNGMV
jgi:CheY-like chemotaxis protein